MGSTVLSATDCDTQSIDIVINLVMGRVFGASYDIVSLAFMDGSKGYARD